jgi:putative ABC transport system permease protein
VLKGKHGTVGGGQVRNALVVFQFAISVFLIVSTLVVFQQINFIQHKDLGFQKDQVLIIDDLKAAGDQVESLKEEIKRINRVEDVSLSSYLPTPSARHGSTYFPEGAMENGVFKSDNALIIEQWTIDYDYANALGLEIIAGRNFDRQFSTDSSALLLNETVVQMMELEPEEVLGRRLTTDFHRPDKENMEYLTVIGVVKNFHFESLRNGIDALSLILGNEADRMIVKLSAGDFSQTIGEIEERWDKVAPGQPLNYYFMDDSFNDTYQAEQRLGRIFMVFTMLSLCIACLGLFGLATFNAERRTKEIGIKKVMGASVKQITFQLSAGFLKLVAIALVVSLPLSWYAMNKWLEAFTYRIEITWWTFAVAAFLAVAIAVITVSYQSIKAAIMNPVNSLRSE